MDCTRTWSAHRTHNDVNELIDRDPDGTGIGNPALDLAYDKAGNLRTEQIGDGSTTVTYTHDAWNRVVEVKYATFVRGEYVYNGLNWRIIKRSDTDANKFLDQQRIMYYSAGWQLLEERIDDDSPFTPDPLAADVDRHVQYVWGARYIDDVILHREDKNKDGKYDDTYYHLTDVQFSTVAVIDGAAGLVERITYTAYGQARHHYMADVDGDGDVDKPDLYGIRGTANGLNHAIGQANYDADMDIDRDGDVTLTDYTIAVTDGTHPALALGLISDPAVDNQIGWDGYVFNAETQHYHVRFRWYDTVLGRWLERDPAGYVDHLNLYQYVLSNPLSFIDAFGLECGDCDPEVDNEAVPPMLPVAFRERAAGFDPDVHEQIDDFLDALKSFEKLAAVANSMKSAAGLWSNLCRINLTDPSAVNRLIAEAIAEGAPDAAFEGFREGTSPLRRRMAHLFVSLRKVNGRSLWLEVQYQWCNQCDLRNLAQKIIGGFPLIGRLCPKKPSGEWTVKRAFYQCQIGRRSWGNCAFFFVPGANGALESPSDSDKANCIKEALRMPVMYLHHPKGD